MIKEFFKSESPEITKLAKHTLMLVLFLNVIGFIVALLPYERAPIVGGLFIFSTLLIILSTSMDSEHRYIKNSELKGRVIVSSLLCFVTTLVATFLLVSFSSDIELETKIVRADNTKWTAVKPEGLNLNGYRKGYYTLKTTTSGNGEVETDIEPVYLNSETLLKGDELNKLSLYKYKKTVYRNTPFGKCKDHDETYYELKE